MLEQIHLAQLGGANLAPEAIIRTSVADVSDRLGVEFEHSHDDLDHYDAAFFRLRGLPFGLVHYRGEPEDNLTVYLAREPRRSEEVSRLLSGILEELDLPQSALVWQEMHAPEL